MLDKRQLIFLLPYVLLLVVGYFTGIAGWGYNIADEHWKTFLYTMSVVLAGSVILCVLWLFSPSAKANNMAGVKTAALISIVWFFEGIVLAVIVNTIIYDQYSKSISVPYAAIVIVLWSTVFIQFVALTTARMPSLLQRIVIAWPAAVITSAVLISLVSIVVFPMITWIPYGSTIFLIPLVLSIIGLYQTNYTPTSVEDWDYIRLEAPGNPTSLKKVKRSKNLTKTKFSLSASQKPNRAIRIVQITDPHIGTMMSISRLRTICEQTVLINPDIVLLTGDFYTVEAYEHSQHALANGLEPLKELPGKVFACIGNHDQEHCAQQRATEDLKRIGANLLIGEQATIQLDVGTVQIIGLDFMRPSARRTAHIDQVMNQKFPPVMDNCLRIVMLHDPGAFHLLPDQKNMVFSGHTHGGQFGLLSLGINLTLIQLAGIPDQGLFEKASNLLYVHRAHGCRSALGTMMVRLGCPPEFSVMDISI